MNQMNGNGSVTPDNNGSGAQQPSTGDTESVGIDYVTLTSPATTIDGQTYLPLRATFSAFKDQAMSVEWQPDGPAETETHHHWRHRLTKYTSPLQETDSSCSRAAPPTP